MEEVRGAGLSVLGWLLLCGGAIAASISYTMPRTADADELQASITRLQASISGSYVPAPTSMINLGLMQNQLMLLCSGLAAAVVGAVLIAAGRIVMEIGRCAQAMVVAEAPINTIEEQNEIAAE